MAPLYLCIGLTPLAVYLALVAMINLSGRPFVWSGFRDSAALALGVCGLMVAGPLELFLPERAAFRFGPYVWLLLLALYGLVVALMILSTRPRIVIYNASVDELRSVLSPLVRELDADSRWAGDGLAMPQLGIQLHLDATPSMRNVQLVASGREQDYRNWARLQQELRAGLAKTTRRPGRHGIGLLLMSVILLTIVTATFVADRQSIAQAWHEMLRM